MVTTQSRTVPPTLSSLTSYRGAFSKRQGRLWLLLSLRSSFDSASRSCSCDLLAANDHPFVMQLVKTFENAKKVYILTGLITGGELHATIRTIPAVLSRAQSQFFTGSLLLALESLRDRNIVFRNLKPKNVILDAQDSTRFWKEFRGCVHVCVLFLFPTRALSLTC